MSVASLYRYKLLHGWHYYLWHRSCYNCPWRYFCTINEAALETGLLLKPANKASLNIVITIKVQITAASRAMTFCESAFHLTSPATFSNWL